MGTMLAAMLQVQSIERQLAHVRRRLRMRQNAVTTQQHRIDQLKADWQVLHDKRQTRRKDADRLELDLRQREEEVSKYRNALNTARTNKEYAAVLTRINTLKADNSKLEEHALRIMQEVDFIKADSDKLTEQVRDEESRLEEVRRVSADEVGKLKHAVVLAVGGLCYPIPANVLVGNFLQSDHARRAFFFETIDQPGDDYGRFG